MSRTNETTELPETPVVAEAEDAMDDLPPTDDFGDLDEDIDPEEIAAEQQTESPTSTDVTVEEKVGSRDVPPEDELKRRREWDSRVQAQRERERTAQAEVDDLNEQLKAAKKELDKEHDRLLAIIDELTQPTLFSDEISESASDISSDPATISETDEKLQYDESWRSVTLETLGITKPRIVKALTEHEPPLTTLGAIADWTAKATTGGWSWYGDIKGIGKGAAEEIELATAKFWDSDTAKALAQIPAAAAAHIDRVLTDAAGAHGEPSAESAVAEQQAPKTGDLARTEDAPPSIHHARDLGLTKDQIELARYPNLLSQLQSDKRPTVENTVIVGMLPHIAVYPEGGVKCDWKLLALHPIGEDIDDDGNEYTGRVVKLANGTEVRIGTKAEAIYVNV